VAVLAEDGSVLPDGEIGEVAVRGLSVMTGYWNRPEATAETIKNGWLHTGDLGRFMSGNVLFLLDRAKDMIISGGSNVYAVEVEKVLTTHASVGEVAVVGAPDDVWGEVVVAVIVPAAGATVEVSALEGHCRETLAGYKIPRRYEVVDSLPRNAYGKVLKRELRERLAANGLK
jgi:acyl-CoA synthetase (AMP-forming)/AMP-acid ligase II